MAEPGLALATENIGWAEAGLGDVSAEAERKVRSKKEEVRSKVDRRFKVRSKKGRKGKRKKDEVKSEAVFMKGAKDD